MTEKTLLVGLDAFMYLQQLCRIQRGFTVCDSFNRALVDNFNEYAVDGKKALFADSLGGGTGSRNPSTWSSWSLDRMARILENAGYSFEYGTGEIIRM